jgi:predicted nucleotidyltransferase
MIIYKDISGKIEREIVDALALITEIAHQLEIPFFLVGAKARDIFFSAIHDIKTTRASLDIDIGISVNSWDDVTRLIDAMLSTGQFETVNKIGSRFKHKNGALVDIVPFGKIENPPASIQWPTGDHAIMSTIGFSEAFENSMTIRLRNDPTLDVQICTPSAMVLLKLIAWDEKYPNRSKDAQDIQYILEKYIDVDDSRLYEEDIDLLTEDDFDYGRAGARIIGRDIAKIAEKDTMTAITEILERETGADSNLKLIVDMNTGRRDLEGQYQASRALLNQLKRGLTESVKKEN